uniref:Solute carrier family 40 member n=1 Tax=Oryza meridionalis TaxID=40149 RepID=A0A0E0D7N6_9ORYZ
MEAVASLPLPLPASCFLSPPHPTPVVAAACFSRRNTSCARAAPQALEAPEASRPPPWPSPRCSAVAEVKAAPDPVAALISLQWFPCSIRRGGPPAIDCIDRRCFLQSIYNVSPISMDRAIEASRGRQAGGACQCQRDAQQSRSPLRVEEAVDTVRRGWSEYMQQPVLPASLAYVLVCFNVALAPGALMTTFLIHQGEMTRMVIIADKAHLVNGVCGVGRREAVGDRHVRRLVGGGAHRQVPAMAVVRSEPKHD